MFQWQNGGVPKTSPGKKHTKFQSAEWVELGMNFFLVKIP